MKKKAVYAGSFDPITKGHEWVIWEALQIFESLTVAIAINPAKKYTFDLEERQQLIRGCFPDALRNPLGTGIELAAIGNEFLVDWANDHDYTHLIRGIRNATDFEFEQAMRNINRDRMPTVETVFLIPPRELCETSSSMVKSLVGVNGWETLAVNYASRHVVDALATKMLKKP
jgi:pantetheine-phosphate adenylyltransferase